MIPADTLARWKEQAQPWNTPGLTNEDIESVAFQVAGAIACRPCGATACSQEHPAQPSQWCRSCLLAVLVDSYVAEVEALRVENARLKKPSITQATGQVLNGYISKLRFYDRPGGPSGNGYVLECAHCAHVFGQGHASDCPSFDAEEIL